MYYLTDEDYAVAKSNGIDRKLAYNRYYNYHYDVQRAITEPVGTVKRITTNMGLWEELKDVAEQNGISKQVFYNRLNSKSKKKWTAEEAASHPVSVRRKTTIHPKIYELAENNGIGLTTLRNRVYTQHWNQYRAATEPVNTVLNWRAY